MAPVLEGLDSALVVLPRSGPPGRRVTLRLVDEPPRQDGGSVKVRLWIRRFKLRRSGPTVERWVEVPWDPAAGDGGGAWETASLDLDLQGAWHLDVRARVVRDDRVGARRPLRHWLVDGRAAAMSTLLVALTLVLAALWTRPFTGIDVSGSVLWGAVAVVLSGRSGEALTERFSVAFERLFQPALGGVLDLPRRAVLASGGIALAALLLPSTVVVVDNQSGRTVELEARLYPSRSLEHQQTAAYLSLTKPRPRGDNIALEWPERSGADRLARRLVLSCDPPVLQELTDLNVAFERAEACREGEVEVALSALSRGAGLDADDLPEGAIVVVPVRHDADPEDAAPLDAGRRARLWIDNRKLPRGVAVSLAAEPERARGLLRASMAAKSGDLLRGPLLLPDGHEEGTAMMALSEFGGGEAELSCSRQQRPPASHELHVRPLLVRFDGGGGKLRGVEIRSTVGDEAQGACTSAWSAASRARAQPRTCRWQHGDDDLCAAWDRATLQLDVSVVEAGWSVELDPGADERVVDVRDPEGEGVGAVTLRGPGSVACGPVTLEHAERRGVAAPDPRTLLATVAAGAEGEPLRSNWQRTLADSRAWACLPPDLAEGTELSLVVDGRRYTGRAGRSVLDRSRVLVLERELLPAMATVCVDRANPLRTVSCGDCARTVAAPSGIPPRRRANARYRVCL